MSTFNNSLEGKEFEEYVSSILDEFHTAGMAIGVIHKNDTWSKGFGYSHLGSKTPVTPRSLFYAGSTTKSFTAASAAKLVYSDDPTRKDINWKTKLASLIRDDFVLQDDYVTYHITLVDALSHRTGMPKHDMSFSKFRRRFWIPSPTPRHWID